MKRPSPKLIKLMLLAILKNKESLIIFSDSDIRYLSDLNFIKIQFFGFSPAESIKIAEAISEEKSNRMLIS